MNVQTEVNLRSKVVETFVDRFNAQPTAIVRAPGRVNLIGEHTDYNDGFVLPMAIDRAAWIALRPRADGVVSVASLDFEQTAAFSLDRITHSDEWDEYLRGVAWALKEDGLDLSGWEGVIGSEIPIGAGLSSSAAVEMATVLAFAAVSGFERDPEWRARLGQTAENEWVGAQTGIMDQMASAGGIAGHALLIDCRSLQSEPVRLPPEVSVVVLDTGTRRGLVDSAYNLRREQCSMATEHFSVLALRDVSLERLQTERSEMDPIVFRRARHVINENQRVLDMVAAMKQGDIERMGQLVNESHDSLRDDFEVSSPALDQMVEIARRQAGCLGARMTGAGFGGCAMALVTDSEAGGFVQDVRTAYQVESGLEPEIYLCEASDGAKVFLTEQQSFLE